MNFEFEKCQLIQYTTKQKMELVENKRNPDEEAGEA